MELQLGNYLKMDDQVYVVGVMMVRFYFKGGNRWWKCHLTDMIGKKLKVESTLRRSFSKLV